MTEASDVLVERLLAWGVDTVFGLPGDGINGVFEALRKNQDKIRFIHVRHEEAAAFMACAYAKFTGRLGVCIATSGPGGIHLLKGLYDAKMDHAPVLAITGLQHSDLIGTLTQQDVALDKLFIDVAHFNERVMSGAHMESLVDLAIRTALSSRVVAHLTIPVDVQVQEVKKGRSERNPLHHTSAVPAYFDQVPARIELEHAADILNRGKRIAILAGQGALHATDELEEIAETLGAPVIKALLGKASVPDDSPYTTGGNSHRKKLVRDGLVYRYLPKKGDERESAFLACSFWFVQNLLGAGRRSEATRLFERLLNLRNDVGLLSEEYDPSESRFLGNSPQALSHIALINAGRMLSTC